MPTPVSRDFTWRTTAEELAALFKEEIRGKVVVVTGVSPSSLGAETVRVLAPYAKTVIAASRTPARTEETLGAIRSETPSADLRAVELDLGDLESVKRAAKEILAFDLPINVLIANAGVPQYSALQRTKQGFEAQFGTNHLGHFLLASLLFPSLQRASTPSFPSRIITVSSVAITFGGDIRWDDHDYRKRPEEYEKYGAYIPSKLANVLFAKEVAKRYAGKEEGAVVGFSLHPGGIWDTNMGAMVPKEELIAMGFMTPDGKPAMESVPKSIPQGSATTIAAAFDPTILAHAGAYLDDSVPHNERLPATVTEESAAKLWTLSEELVGSRFGV